MNSKTETEYPLAINYDMRPGFNYDGALREDAIKRTNPTDIGFVKSGDSLSDAIISSIKPEGESVSSDTLEYGHALDEKAVNVLNESSFPEMRKSFENEELRLRNFDKAVNIQYLGLMAWYSNNQELPIEVRQKWADEFTKKSIEVYGQPDAEVASDILRNGIENFYEKYEHIRVGIAEYLDKKYPGLFDELDLDSEKGELDAMQIAETFKKGLDLLKQNDGDWQDWEVVITDGSTITVYDKRIEIGQNMAPKSPLEVKKFFAHEVLRHAQGRINGSKADKLLGNGLPDSTGAEEGFAVLFGYAVSGIRPDNIVYKYCDIAAALGQIEIGDGSFPKLSRRMLAEAVTRRERSINPDIDNEKILNKAYEQVNRIFRGTPGNDEVSGVFTKDIVYFKGFVDSLEYIEREIANGKSIEKVMDYVMLGRFDPNNLEHVRYVESIIKTQGGMNE